MAQSCALTYLKNSCADLPDILHAVYGFDHAALSEKIRSVAALVAEIKLRGAQGGLALVQSRGAGWRLEYAVVLFQNWHADRLGVSLL